MLLGSHSSIRGLAGEATSINKLKKIGFAAFDLPSAPCNFPAAVTKTRHLTGGPKTPGLICKLRINSPQREKKLSCRVTHIRNVESLLLPCAQKHLHPQLLPCFHVAWAMWRQCCVPFSCLLHSGCSSPWKPVQIRHFVMGSLSCWSLLNACISFLWSGTFSVAGFLVVFPETSHVPRLTCVVFLSRSGYQSVSRSAAAFRAAPFCNVVLSWLWTLPT